MKYRTLFFDMVFAVAVFLIISKILGNTRPLYSAVVSASFATTAAALLKICWHLLIYHGKRKKWEAEITKIALRRGYK